MGSYPRGGICADGPRSSVFRMGVAGAEGCEVSQKYSVNGGFS